MTNALNISHFAYSDGTALLLLEKEQEAVPLSCEWQGPLFYTP